MIGVIVLKQFIKFEKVKSGTPFKTLFFLFHVDTLFKQCINGITIREGEGVGSSGIEHFVGIATFPSEKIDC